ncbi:MAG: hypothetical protein M1837_003326 [Sclerophora amabilis]|nr:MAG: hypothetical protein M1837_003326 [Sclerophora amabilis]
MNSQTEDKRCHSGNVSIQAARNRLAAVTPSIQAIQTLFQATSLSIGVRYHGYVIFTGGFGFSDRERNRRPDGDTVYTIASCTKGFSGTAISLLAEHQKLDLDEKVSKYIPGLNTVHSPEVSQKMTVRDMLTHCSGLASMPYEVVGKNGSVFARRGDVIKICSNLPKASEFRSEWRYNNWMYALAGVLITQLSGMSFGELIHQRIFKELGMKRSYTCNPVDENVAKAYIVYDDNSFNQVALPALWDGEAFDSSGCVRSCVNDLLIWAAALMYAWRASTNTKEEYAVSQPLSCVSLLKSCFGLQQRKTSLESEEANGKLAVDHVCPAPNDLVSSMATVQKAHCPLANDPKQAYALGLFTFRLPTQEVNVVTNSDVITTPYKIGADSPGRTVIGHTGELGGFLSAYWTFPEDDSAVVVLCNSFQLNGDPTNVVAQLIVQTLFDLQPKIDFIAVASEIVYNARARWTKIVSKWNSNRVSGTAPRSLKSYAGTFINEGLAMEIAISVLAEDMGDRVTPPKADTSLRLRINGAEEQTFDLYHYHHDSWTFLPKSRDDCFRLGYSSYLHSWQAFIIDFEDFSNDHCGSLLWKLDPDPRIERQCFVYSRD